MNKNQQDFFNHQAQTTKFASAFEVDRAEGCYIYGKDGKRYLDLVAGVSAVNLGHSHPRVIKTIKDQVDRHLHVMVYGEYVQDVQLQLANALNSILPDSLEMTYIVNSGTEAIEASLKLAKRFTGRSKIVAAFNAYHGNTQGAMSICGNEDHKRAFRPLIPGTCFIRFNSLEDLNNVTNGTAAVILETIQGAAGFIVPDDDYFQKLRKRCDDVGALLILDEIQPGFGRTGKLFGFEHYNIIPDILVIGKAMAGGMPIGALVSSKEIMLSLSHSPKLGHITTFGGHPVNCAAAVATLEVLTTTDLIDQVYPKEMLFRELLVHPNIKGIFGKGLMLAIELENEETVLNVVEKAMEKSLILFFLLYKGNRLRITPPLTISEDEIRLACEIILQCLNEVD